YLVADLAQLVDRPGHGQHGEGRRGGEEAADHQRDGHRPAYVDPAYDGVDHRVEGQGQEDAEGRPDEDGGDVAQHPVGHDERDDDHEGEDDGAGRHVDDEVAGRGFVGRRGRRRGQVAHGGGNVRTSSRPRLSSPEALRRRASASAAPMAAARNTPTMAPVIRPTWSPVMTASVRSSLLTSTLWAAIHR